MSTRRRRTLRQLWREWKANLRFLNNWLALLAPPWWTVVDFYDTCTALRRDPSRSR